MRFFNHSKQSLSVIDILINDFRKVLLSGRGYYVLFIKVTMTRFLFTLSLCFFAVWVLQNSTMVFSI